MTRNKKCCTLDCWMKVVAWNRLIVSGTLSLTLLVGFFFLAFLGPIKVNKMILSIEPVFEGVLVKGYQMDGVMIRILILIVIEFFSTLSGLFLLKAAYQGKVNLLWDWRIEMAVTLIFRILIITPVVPYSTIFDIVFTGLSIAIVHKHVGIVLTNARQTILV